MRKTPTWGAIKPLAGAYTTQITAVMPFVGYIILFNEPVVNFLKQINKNFELNISSISLVNLYFLYYGLVAIGISSILYRLYCPVQVKKYDSNIEFVVASLQTTLRGDFIAMAEKIKNNAGSTDDSKKKAELLFNVLSSSGEISIPQEDKIHILKEWYGALDNSSPFIRWSAAILLGIGMILLVLPTVKLSYGITRSVF